VSKRRAPKYLLDELARNIKDLKALA